MNTNPITPEAVAALLRTAGTPAAPGELRGEAAALAAFRTVHRPAAATRSVPFMNRLTRVLTVKAAAVTIAVTGMGGVALAAGTGTLPVPADTPVVGSEAKAEKKAKKAKAAQEQKVRDWSGLCVAATEGNALKNPGKAAESTAFSGLITAAGGAAFVPAFCDGVLGTVPPVTETPVVPVPETPVTTTEAEGSNGKSGASGKDNAPGQTKVEGEPATGKGKATAPGQNKTDEAPATDKGKATAPGQNKTDEAPATNKGKATAPGQNKTDGEPAAGKGPKA